MILAQAFVHSGFRRPFPGSAVMTIKMKTWFIIVTYQSPDYLVLVLSGYGCQTVSGFELIIADDHSYSLAGC